jgi:Zn2+/Cd2+-exporting ATPase
MNAPVQETTFLIHDLCCATEEQLIRKRLRNEPGVHELEFNIISHKLRVRHTCSEEMIERRLKDIGLPGINAAQGSEVLNKTYRKLLLWTGTSAALFLGGLLAPLLSQVSLIPQILFAASMVTGGWHIAAKAYKAVRARSLEMNSLMTVAAIGAVAVGQYAEGAAVMLLFSVSLLLESMSTEGTRQAIRSLMKLSPPTAAVLRNGLELIMPLDQIAVGETVLVRPGERIPFDGRVSEGASSVDEAPITGEPFPASKSPGDAVYAGSFNQLGSLSIEIARPSTDSTIARIIHVVEEAQTKKAPTQTAVERFAHYYTPSVFGLAIAVAFLPPLILGAPFADWFYRSLVLLVIACPCALVISTPVTLACAMTNAARNGILIKGGKHLELLAHVKAIAFDKTGTLTLGRPVVTDIVALDSLTASEILRIAAAAELHSEHHVADALLRKAKESGIALTDLVTEDFSSITGKGVRTRVNGTTYIVGNHLLMEELGVCSPIVEKELFALERMGKTVVILSDTRRVLGLLAISDAVRAESRSAVDELHSAGVHHVVLLTGDNEKTADLVGKELKLDEVRSDLLPEGKLHAIESLRHQYGVVAMVGDGINDAPALAAADVGIAMGGVGSDVALETGTIILMSDNVSKIAHGILLGKKALRIIKQNIFLALLTKGVFLALGVFGWTSLWLAILADDGATLLVILNSLRALRGRPDSPS